MEASGLELALAGERACKAGDFTAGVAFFEAAVQVGTDDLKTLSAIYSQLGNAYFYLKEYAKALEFHRHDLTLARTIGDRIGEAKASGNLGNTLKILGQFDEAVVCCQRHLDISQEQGDKVGEARALYNIGNVYHAKGKQLSWSWPQEPGQLPQEVQEALERASEFYERNLSLVKELGDRAAQGRAYGNLGNSQYLLGNFGRAVIFHKQRLAIAKEFGDKSAERRAYSNLGNAHIFLGRFDISAEYYKKTLQLSRQLKDHVMEAQSCYSLGNTYTLLQDYEKAIEYHLKHLAIAQELGDRVGEGRACWSLENAYMSLGKREQALAFAERHLEISQETGDLSGELTARATVSQLGLKHTGEESEAPGFEGQGQRGLCVPSFLFGEATMPGGHVVPTEHLQKHSAAHSSLPAWRVGCCPAESLATRKALSGLFTHHQGDQGQQAPPRGQGSLPAGLGNKRHLSQRQRGCLRGSRPRAPWPSGVGNRRTPFTAIPLWRRGGSTQWARPKRIQRNSMSNLDLLTLPSEKDQNGVTHHRGELKLAGKDFLPLPIRSHKYRESQSMLEGRPPEPSASPLETSDVCLQLSQLKIKRVPLEEECFFDLLSKFQSNRMDDQRCTLDESQKELDEAAATHTPVLEERLSQSLSVASPQTEELFDLIASSQSRRLDDQRASVGNLPGLRITHNNLDHLRKEPGDAQEPGDEFFNMLMKCQSSRIDDQRCAPPNSVPRGPTVPDEDFFSLIQRVQAKRMDEQRVDLASAQEEEEEGGEAEGGEQAPDQQQRPSFS
ncbi:G-protein-signaling modulator 1 [Varanus komodoensis]|uniref:G-protein-signaling modulator 1 n=1 Tax=Varanus komodoensis TaxID=61221 RepID=UPI001CF7EC65|nr:G-protein-signaling modulator 1 [Varanus komodoensis]